MALKLTDLTGRIFGRLRVIKPVDGLPPTPRTHKWLCECECGASTSVRACDLLSGNTLSCACLMRDTVKTCNATHGLRNTDEYRIWGNILQRCLNKNNPAYKNYGGRGIYVSEEWMTFENFYRDVGGRPSALFSIERSDNDGPYAPWNCSWELRETQANNRRNNKLVEIGGVVKTLTQWCLEMGLRYDTVKSRLLRGWPIERAFNLEKSK